MRLFFYGPSDLAQRLPLEERLKKDKLIKATQLKQTRKDAENRRTITKLRNGGTTVGLGVSGEPETGPEDTSMDQLLEKSQVLTDIREGDAIKTLSLGQAELEAMPKAQQPHQLKSALLPYQLQVSPYMFLSASQLLMFPTGPGLDDCKRSTSGSRKELGRDRTALETLPERQLSQRCIGLYMLC